MSEDRFISRWFPLSFTVYADKNDVVTKKEFTTFDSRINKLIYWTIIPYEEQQKDKMSNKVDKNA